jgi:hypothetical protein
MTHDEVLVSVEALHAHDPAIWAATEPLVTGTTFAGDPSYEMPLRYYLVFSEGLMGRVGLGEMTSEASFYNAYYWFKRFVAECSARRGYDAGLEQQAYQMLESAPDDVDWSVLGEIDARLNTELGPR